MKKSDNLDSLAKGLDNSRLESILKDVIGSKVFESLKELDKEELLKQIESLEKDGLLDNGVKINVKPGFIDLVRKITGVHDIKGGAYRGTTVYLGSKEDLFNKELITHESIHVKQQSELSKLKFVGFVKWLLAAAKGMKEYKKENGDHKDVNYESTIMIPTELEAYAYSDDPDYLKTRNEKEFETYNTKEKQQEVMKIIEKRNYKAVKKNLQKDGLVSDLKKLEDIMDKTKDSDWTLYIFNNVDEVNELNNLKKVFEKKIDLLKSGKDFDKKFEELKKKYDREAVKFNLHVFLEDDFQDIEVLQKELEKIDLNIKKYERAPARFWLEDKNHKDKVIELGL